MAPCTYCDRDKACLWGGIVCFIIFLIFLIAMLVVHDRKSKNCDGGTFERNELVRDFVNILAKSYDWDNNGGSTLVRIEGDFPRSFDFDPKTAPYHHIHLDQNLVHSLLFPDFDGEFRQLPPNSSFPADFTIRYSPVHFSKTYVIHWNGTNYKNGRQLDTLLTEFDFEEDGTNRKLATIKKQVVSVKHTYTLCFYTHDTAEREMVVAATIGFDQESEDERDNALGVKGILMIFVIIFACFVFFVVLFVLYEHCIQPYCCGNRSSRDFLGHSW